MKKGFCLAAFLLGTAVGAVTAWQYAKRKYERIAQEEIDSVKEVFSKREQKTDKETKEQEYGELLRNTGYSNYSSEKRKGEKEVEFREPYVISPEEFGEMNDYEKISLTYYANGILADENDEVIDDIEETVGDALEHFGEYEDDSVFVRNEENVCDYEILFDQRNFSEITGVTPFRMEGV
jgi:hypothetical protein